MSQPPTPGTPDPDGTPPQAPGWAQQAGGPAGPPPVPDAPAGSGSPSAYGPPPGYGPPPPVPPTARPKRFSGGMIAVGVISGMVVAVGVPLLLLAVLAGIGPDQAAVGWTFVGLGVLVPAVLGGVLVARGSPERRGFGLGLLIGWATATLVGGGLCVALIMALSAGTAP